MKKAGLVFFIVSLFVLSLSPFAFSAVEKKTTIGLALGTTLVERWSKEAKAFSKEAAKLGVKVVVQDAGDNENTQNSQIENLISQEVDALVIVPVNSKTAAAGVAAAKKAGIPVMAYSRMILNADLDCYVGFEVVDIGRTLARAAVAAKPKGNYIIINGAPTDNNAKLEQQGYMQILQPSIQSGDIKIVFEQWCENWAPENALAATENALTQTKNRIDAALVSNDGMAGGVVQAIKAQKLDGKVFVTGTDGELAALQRIAEGSQTVTLLFPSQQFAETAAQGAVEMAKTKKAPSSATGRTHNGLKDVPQIVISTILVNQENLPETVIYTGFAKLEDVYKNVPKDQWPAMK